MLLTMRLHAVIALSYFAPLVLDRAFAAPLHSIALPNHECLDKRGAVASEVSTCSRIGVDLIQKGGNAADAVSGRSNPPLRVNPA